jgi:ribosomal protein S18 acetylase RimI-like enzyme
MTEALVRAATVDDAPAIADIHVLGWQTTYRGLVPDAILDRLSIERRRVGWHDIIERQVQARDASDDSVTDRTWVVEADGLVVGFAATGPGRSESAPPPEGAGEIHSIYVAQGSSGRGFGRALFARAVEDLRARGFEPLVVWVFEANAVARRFYEAAGFRDDGVRYTIDFDGTPIDEIRYRLDSSL